MRICKECGIEFVKKARVTGNKYCSRDCYNENSRKRHNLMFGKGSGYGRQHLPTTKNCKYCNKEFVTTMVNRRTCCTRERYTLYSKENGLHGYSKLQEKTCKVCCNKFTTRYSPALYCSKECRKIMRLAQMKVINANQHPAFTKKCNWCGQEFVTRKSYKVYCNKKCQINHAKSVKTIRKGK